MRRMPHGADEGVAEAAPPDPRHPPAMDGNCRSRTVVSGVPIGVTILIPGVAGLSKPLKQFLRHYSQTAIEVPLGPPLGELGTDAGRKRPAGSAGPATGQER